MFEEGMSYAEISRALWLEHTVKSSRQNIRQICNRQVMNSDISDGKIKEIITYFIYGYNYLEISDITGVDEDKVKILVENNRDIYSNTFNEVIEHVSEFEGAGHDIDYIVEHMQLYGNSIKKKSAIKLASYGYNILERKYREGIEKALGGIRL